MKKKLFFFALACIALSISCNNPQQPQQPQQWIKVGQAAGHTGASFKGSIVSDNGITTNPTTGAAFVASTDGTGKVINVSTFGTSWSNLTPLKLTNHKLSGDSFIAADFSGTIYLAFQSTDNVNPQLHYITVEKLVNSQWVQVGQDIIFQANAAGYSPQLAFSNNNTPFIAYSDRPLNSGGKITVKKFDGTNWATLGTDGFTNSSQYLTLDIDKFDMPYIGYLDFVARQIVVQKFDGQTWKKITGSQSLGLTYPSIKIDRANNKLYIATGTGLKLYSYVNNTWSLVADGSGQFGGDYQKLMLDANNVPYVSFTGSNSQITTVRLNSTQFELVGTSGYSGLSGCGGQTPAAHFSFGFDIKHNYPITGICCDCGVILGNGSWVAVFEYK